MFRYVLALVVTSALFIPIGFTTAADKANVNVKGSPQLKITPPEGAIKTCSLVKFKIETNGKQVLVKINSPTVETSMDSGGRELVVLFHSPGDYKIWAITSMNDELVESEISVTVVKNDNNPDPPGPKPPAPPVPPTPVDPLVKEFQDAYNLDNAPDKRERMGGLVRAMRYGVDQASVKATNGDVVAAVASKTKEEVADSLLGVRKSIGKYLNGVLGEDNMNMTPDLRKKYAAEYTKVADALEKVNK